MAVAEGLDQMVRAVLGQGNAHAGIDVVKRGQQLGQDLDRAAADHADRYLAPHQAGELVHGQAGVRDGAESGAGKGKHGRSHLGEPDRPAGAVE